MLFVGNQTEGQADEVFNALGEKLQAIYRRPYLPQGVAERCLLLVRALLEVPLVQLALVLMQFM